MVKILVVDDMPSQRELITHFLQQRGYTVFGASGAKEALTKTEELKPDVIVTDVVMPEMNGFELCRQLKKNPNTQHLPVVACTTKNQELDRLWGFKQGVDVYITKPFKQDDLLQAVQSVLN